MRVIGGKYRGKKLLSAPEEVTRPTSDRAKEGLFNVLNHCFMQAQKNWEDVVFVDAFAGSGSIGIEAVSRGAKNVFFFENNPIAQSFMLKNLSSLPKSYTLYKNALCPPKAKMPSTVYFSDAPYHKNLSEQALQAFYQAGWIDKNTLIIIEADYNETLAVSALFTLQRELSYGRNKFCIYQLTEGL